MAAKRKPKSSRDSSARDSVVYREFGSADAAFDRPVPELPPNQQDLRIQASRKGRGGKTVTVITGFQSKPETLKELLKTLKGQCGTGGTVKDQTLEIQGDHRETLLASLMKLGYRAKVSGG
ncbi:MAG: translation initiation factor [Prochlorothrix sp.]|nr:translation initiation factor [Prochlorothrix sp.]